LLAARICAKGFRILGSGHRNQATQTAGPLSPESGNFCWIPVIVVGIQLAGARIWPFASDSGRNPAVLCQIPTKVAGIWHLSRILAPSLEFGNSSQILANLAVIWPVQPDVDHNCWNFVTNGFLLLVIFSYESNTEKYFQENHFFFFMEKHFTSKQIEH